MDTSLISLPNPIFLSIPSWHLHVATAGLQITFESHKTAFMYACATCESKVFVQERLDDM